MQWIFVFIGAFIAAIAEENALVGGVFGFFIWHFISVPKRLKALEAELDELRLSVNQLKHSKTTAKTDEKPSESVPEQVSEPPPEEEKGEEHVSFIKPQVEIERSLAFEKAETVADISAQDPWVSEDREQKAENRKVEFVETEPVHKEIEATALEKLFQFVWNWFTDGNTFVRVGIVILFVGVSFLLNFAIEKGFISIELRLAAVAAFAIFLLSVGWKLKEKREAYALLIQGGAIGLLYLTIFASFSLYKVMPSALAFSFLVIIVALATALAVLQNALSLALFGVIGGFLAPILTSTGTNNYIGLFSFYSLLNAGILAIAWFKAWKILNLVGFTFTFSIGSFWGASRYQPENFATVEPFLILFFLFYVGIAILYATHRAVNFRDYVDGTLIFGTPIIAFGMQAAMVNRYEYGVAISAFVMGLFYLVLASLCWKKIGEQLRFLSETLLSVAVIFITLAIPFAVDGATTSATWAVEATGVLWVSIRQNQHFRRVFALLLEFCAGFALFFEGMDYHATAFLNSSFIGVLIVTICAVLTSWMLYQPFEGRKNYEKMLSPWILSYGILWLFGGYEYQIESHRALRSYHGDLILFLTLLVNAALGWAYKRLEWTTANRAGLWMALPLLMVALASGEPSRHYGLLLWPLAIGIYFWNLKNSETIGDSFKLKLHLFTTALVYLVLLREGVGQLLLGASLLTLLFYQLYKRLDWPQMQHCALSLLPMMLFLAFTCLLSPELHPFDFPDNFVGENSNFEAGYVMWPLAFMALYRLFYDCDKDNSEVSGLPLFHALALLLLAALPTWEASWHLTRHLSTLNGWHIALFPLTAIYALWLIMQADIWPFKQHHESYLKMAAPPLIIYLFICSLAALRSAADSVPLPWIPFINPAELMQIIIFITLIRFAFVTEDKYLSEKNRRRVYVVIAHCVFIWLNFVLLRTIHHWGGLPWSGSLWRAALTQTCLSIFWTLTGLSLTVLATRRQIRKLWIVGASLLVVVIIKLLLLDMASHNSIERIVSFITVGVLLMLIGYFAPLPPAEKEAENAE